MWNQISSGSQIYWRAHGVEKDVEPQTVVIGDEL